MISYYGKLPSHGDFLSRQAPRAFTDVWDSWLQESLLGWRNKLPEGWVADYMTMEPYHFILSSGIAGETIWCGVLLPSRDKSGRLFPFTACISLEANQLTPLELFSTHHEWLKKLEKQTINCLMPDFDTEKLGGYQKELDILAKECSDIVSQSQAYSCRKTDSKPMQRRSFAWHTGSLKNTSPATTMSINNELLDILLNEYCHSYSLWWTRNNADFMLCQGLPTADLMPAFIDHQWAKWGWLIKSKEAKSAQEELTSPSKEDDTQTYKVK